MSGESERGTPEAVSLLFSTKEKKCPKCDRVGIVADDFGIRLMCGEYQAQSWCLKCRRAGVKLKEDPKPLEVLPADTESLRALYQEHYPNDSQRRGPKIMRERLSKKLGLNQA